MRLMFQHSIDQTSMLLSNYIAINGKITGRWSLSVITEINLWVMKTLDLKLKSSYFIVLPWYCSIMYLFCCAVMRVWVIMCIINYCPLTVEHISYALQYMCTYLILLYNILYIGRGQVHILIVYTEEWTDGKGASYDLWWETVVHHHTHNGPTGYSHSHSHPPMHTSATYLRPPEGPGKPPEGSKEGTAVREHNTVGSNRTCSWPNA